MLDRRRAILVAALLLVALASLFAVILAREQHSREAEAVAQHAQAMQAVREREALAFPEATERAPLALDPTPDEVATAMPADARTGTRTIRVLVLDREEERPLAGARVAASKASSPGAATTDASGSCALQARADASELGLAIDREGYFHVRANYPMRSEIRVRMVRTIRVHGRILDAVTLAPIPGAKLTLLHDACPNCRPEPVVAGPNGEYELAGVPFDKAWFMLAAQGYPNLPVQLVFRPDAEASPQDFKLARGLELRGQVVDFTAGSGIQGATLRFSGNEVVADASGRFEGSVLQGADGALAFAVLAPQRCQLRVRYTREELERQSPLLLRLPASPIIEGTLRDANGAGLAGVRVLVKFDQRALQQAWRLEPPTRSAVDEIPDSWKFEDQEFLMDTSDAAGGFRLQGLVPWGEHRVLVVEHAGFEKLEHPLARLDGPGELRRADLVLRRIQPDSPAGLKGRVELNGVVVPATLLWSAAGVESSKEFATPVGYLLSDLPAGPLRVRASPSDFPGPFENDSFSVTLLAGQTLVHDFELVGSTLEISGRVQFPDGSAAAGADVHASYMVQRGARKSLQRLTPLVRSSADGEFTLRVPVTDRSLRVEAWLQAATASVDGVRAGTEDLVLGIARSGSILLRAIDSNTREPLSVRSLKPSIRRQAALAFIPMVELFDPPDQEGWQRIEALEGRTELTLAGGRSGYCAITTVLDVPPGGEIRSELELERGLEVSIRLDPNAALRSSHMIFVLEPHLADAVRMVQTDGIRRLDSGGNFTDEGLMERMLDFDESGVARLKSLAPGRYSLKALPEDLKLEPQEIELTTDVKEPIVIRWSKSK